MNVITSGAVSESDREMKLPDYSMSPTSKGPKHFKVDPDMMETGSEIIRISKH